MEEGAVMMGRRSSRVVLGATVWVCGWACSGLEWLDDEVHEGQSARTPTETVLGVSLPEGAKDLRYVRSAGMDWVVTAQFQANTDEANAWFEPLTLPCDQPTTTKTVGDFGLIRFHGVADRAPWSIPTQAEWTRKRCDPRFGKGTFFEVALAEHGPTSWIWVTAYGL